VEEINDIVGLFNSVLGVEVEFDGVILTDEQKEKRNFLTFVDNYRNAVIRSTKLHEEYGIDVWAYEDTYAKSLEGLIYLAFPEDIAEVILWYVYEHPLAESDEDKTLNDTDGNQYLIHTSEELYNLIVTLQDE
jgi:deferrochelatase/peroxidase EfeB